ncbi:MAG: hypothetical protein WDW38_006605 [Sanguina aurantia]
MKFETLLLHSLFVACFAVCALIMGAMFTTRAPGAARQATGMPVFSGRCAATMLLAAPAHCALRPDGVVGPTSRG